MVPTLKYINTLSSSVCLLSSLSPLLSGLESRRLSNNNIYLSDRISITDVNICYFLFLISPTSVVRYTLTVRAAELAKIGEQIESLCCSVDGLMER